MQPLTSNVAQFPAIPAMQPITTRPVSLSVETRTEIVANVIAGVLHNAYCTQHGLPETQLAHSPVAVQRIYEGMARLALVPLLDPEQVKQAEARAVYVASDTLGNYMDGDPFDDGVPSEVWAKRIETVVRLALVEYQRVLMGSLR